ncbi:MAG TPA: heme o synthase [Oligoflexia bacterium]|nr:heme o synthase [Oligoflexia bacterium]HMR24015.1 heme o synthase [Oligoflexia bacterium]
MAQSIKLLHDLTKPRIALMVALTTALGYFLTGREFLTQKMLITVVAAALASCSASIFNQIIEKETDGLMDRTRLRPLPQKKINIYLSWVLAVFLALISSFMLWHFVNLLSMAITLCTIILYAWVYTPLKRKTHLSTLIGAIPGAFPPVIGWVAANNQLDTGALIVFAILFLWQMPHFIAIAWMYAEDYQKAGFPIVTSLDPQRNFTALQAVLYAAALVPVSLMTTLYKLTGKIYFFGALLLGVYFFYECIILHQKKTKQQAKKVLLASVVYLPILFLLIIVDAVFS